jgi:hypothetical protein
MNKACCWVALCLLLAMAAGAEAQAGSQSVDKKAEASEHFRRAVALFQEDAFRAALAEFERAYEIAPDYRLLYNIGQSKLRLQDYLGAVQSYEVYLTVGGAAVPAERRSQVEQALISLRERVGRVGIACNRAGAEVFIDDVSVGKTPLPTTVPVNVGHHRVFARAPDGASETRLVSVAGGDVAEVSFTLDEAPRPLAVTERPVRDEPWSSKKKAAVATWSGGALLLVASGVTGALTLGTQSDLDGLLKTEGVQPKSVSEKRDSLKTLALTTDVLIGAGALAVVVGTVLWFVDRGAGKKDEAPSRGSARLKLRLQLANNGALLHGKF